MIGKILVCRGGQFLNTKNTMENVLNVCKVVASCDKNKCVDGFCKVHKLENSKTIILDLRKIKVLLDQWKGCLKIANIYFISPQTLLSFLRY